MQTLAHAGHMLRQIRELKGLSMRDVEFATTVISEHFHNPEFVVFLSRLSDIEAKNTTPSLHKLCALALVYEKTLTEMAQLYGIDMEGAARELHTKLSRTHTGNGKTTVLEALVPERIELPSFEPVFSLSKTSYIRRFIYEWGLFPISRLRHLADDDSLYVHIGQEDLTMNPLIKPGSFVQVDQRRRRIVNGGWRNDYERPIYLLETRDGYLCSWCSLPERDQLIVQPHPYSGIAPRVMKHPRDVEVIGTVVGFATRMEPIVDKEA